MRYRFWFVLPLFLAVGCGAKNVAPVSGKVTLDGKPLDNASVTFEPDVSSNPGPTSYGKTDAGGSFSLKVVGSEKNGAMVGKHQVRISAFEGAETKSSDDNPKPLKDKVPVRYNSQSELSIDVPSGGTDAANFDLKSQSGAAGS